jgi:Subtilase family/Peptidase family S41
MAIKSAGRVQEMAMTVDMAAHGNKQRVSAKQSQDGRHPQGWAATIVRDAPEALQEQLGETEELQTFRAHAVELSLADRRRIVEQALVLIERNYVHLRHKIAMHAVNPVQRLRLLQAKLDAATPKDLPPGAAFHAEMSEIFHSMRDLHTNYLLPAPYRGQIAYLPFLVEEFFDNDGPRYLVTKVLKGAPEAGFGKGALVTRWNGMPIARAVEVNAARYAGSNDAAMHSRGVESLTVRPLRIHRYPDEDWVVVGYEKDGVAGEFRQPWLVAPNLPQPVEDGDLTPDGGALRLSLGLDLDLDEAQRARKLLFAPDVAAAELRGKAAPSGAGQLSTSMPGVFRARELMIGAVRYGHLRIFTFNVDSPEAFVAEFVRLAELLPPTGLIVDVRGNGGGHIWAAELTLQTLTPRTITPEPTQFSSNPLNADLCRRHAKGEGGIDLGAWLPSLEQSVETAAAYSNAFPITPTELANAIGQRYHGPVVLVTDARCYSATDIFSAGFADHRIGPIIGVDANTGAGGANVWTHGLLSQLLPGAGSASPYRPLPTGVDMRVSIRRTLRVGAAAGTPVEDLGVRPDVRHLMTRRDLEEDNVDLLATCAKALAAQPVRRLGVAGAVDASGVLKLTLTTTGMDRVDIYLDGRPVASPSVTDDIPTEVTVSPNGARTLRLHGFAGRELVANRQERLGPRTDGSLGVQTGATLVRAPAAAVPTRLRFLISAPGAERSTVQRQVRAVFGIGWSVVPLFDLDGALTPNPALAGFFAATGTLRADSDDERRARAFELSRDLMRRTGYDVQPDLPSGALFPPGGVDGVDPQNPALLAAADHLPGTEDPAWPLDAMRVRTAWANSGSQGAGILVAQPDTGITAHPELAGALDLARGRDVLDDDPDPTDPLTRRWWWMDNPSHGTATASVVVSRDPATIIGSAPQATLVPLRSNRSVVLVFDGDVARAVERARASGCHIITMSLGGVGFSPALQAAIDAAIADGIIVLAAAGNQVGFVVAPASYHEVIAVAASTIQDGPWSGSSHGSAVDVTAPGQSVHTARASKEPAGNRYYTTRSHGTSFAVGLTAGVAALWLAHHGRDVLIARYGKGNLQAVFADLLRRTARRPAGWDTGQYGAGIVNAEALLAAQLPVAVPPLAIEPAQALTAAQRLAPYLPDPSPAAAAAALDTLMPGQDGERDLYAGELAYHLSQDPQVRATFAAVAAASAGAAVAANGLPPTAPADAGDIAAPDAGADQAFGLERLRALASPGLAAALALV